MFSRSGRACAYTMRKAPTQTELTTRQQLSRVSEMILGLKRVSASVAQHYVLY